MVRHEPLVSLDSWRGVLRCHHHLQDDRVTDAWKILEATRDQGPGKKHGESTGELGKHGGTKGAVVKFEFHWAVPMLSP